MTATAHWLRTHSFDPPPADEWPWWRVYVYVGDCRTPVFARVGEPVEDIVRRGANLGVEIRP